MSKLKFEITFGDPAKTEFPEDCTVADLGIAVGDDYLTLHERKARLIQGGKTFSKTVYGPIAGLVDWFIENWSFVLWETQTPFKRGRSSGVLQATPAIPGAKEAANLWEDYILDSNGISYSAESATPSDLRELADWQHRHLMGHASSDLAIPSIVIVPEDENILVCVDRLPTGSIIFCNPDRTRRTATQYSIAKKDFQLAAAGFVESVIGRVHSVGQHSQWADWMEKRWKDAERIASSPAKQLELMIGTVGAARIEGLRQAEPGLASGLKQLLLDCQIVETLGDLMPVEDVVRRYIGRNGARRLSGDTPGWEQLTNISIASDKPEYMQGYQLARHVRSQMEIGTRPIPGITEILNKLDISLENDRSIPLFRAAACATRGYQAHIIPSSSDPRMSLKASKNFAVISALGRLIWEARNPDESTICVAQGDYSILSESRRANAFAAEFLLPTKVVSKLKHQSAELLEAADMYGISHEAANWHALDIERLSASKRG